MSKQNFDASIVHLIFANKLSNYYRIQLLLSGTRDEAHDIIVSSSSSSLSSYVTALKRYMHPIENLFKYTCTEPNDYKLA